MGVPIAEVGYLAGICGFYDPDWIEVLADADGRLQIDVVSSGLPAGGATEAKQDTLIAAVWYRPGTPAIYNVTMTLANTEYSQALPQYVTGFLVKCRGAYAVKLSFTSGQSGTTYLTIPSGCSYWEDVIRVTSLTLYFQCATAAQVVEIVAWI